MPAGCDEEAASKGDPIVAEAELCDTFPLSRGRWVSSASEPG